MTDTDAFKLSNLSIFTKVKDNIAEDSREICDVFEDLLFVWNHKESNLMVTNWRSAQNKSSKGVKHQVSELSIFTECKVNFP